MSSFHRTFLVKALLVLRSREAGGTDSIAACMRPSQLRSWVSCGGYTVGGSRGDI